MSESRRCWENCPPRFFRPRFAKTRNHSQLVLGMLDGSQLYAYLEGENGVEACRYSLLLVDGVAEPCLQVRTLFLGHAIPEDGGNSESKA
jgi:hypothetical protein